VTLATLAYAARRLGEIADDIVNIDRGMRWGFNWELGPFETWDALGLKETAAKMTEAGVTVPAWVAQMIERGFDAFYREQSGELQQYDPRVGEYVTVPRARKEVSLDYLKKRGDAKRIKHKLSASLWDIGEGVLGLELHSALVPKMNPVDDDVISMLHAAVDELEENFDALVLYHDGENFSAGANLMMLFMGAQAGQWDQIRAHGADGFQQANQRLRFSSKPVVAAPAGLALGGGAEMVLGANAVQAAAELYIGLVEVGMGLIPGGGGTLNLLRKLMGPFSNDKDVDPPSPTSRKPSWPSAWRRSPPAPRRAAKKASSPRATASPSTATTSSPPPRSAPWAWPAPASARRSPRSSSSPARTAPPPSTCSSTRWSRTNRSATTTASSAASSATSSPAATAAPPTTPSTSSSSLSWSRRPSSASRREEDPGAHRLLPPEQQTP
jgi:hypothetical protein